VKNKTTKKKRNPPDTTMRNVNALKKRVKELEQHAEWTVASDKIIGRYIAKMESRLSALENVVFKERSLITKPVEFVNVFKKGKK
jgi:hypothetical protein